MPIFSARRGEVPSPAAGGLPSTRGSKGPIPAGAGVDFPPSARRGGGPVPRKGKCGVPSLRQEWLGSRTRPRRAGGCAQGPVTPLDRAPVLSPTLMGGWESPSSTRSGWRPVPPRAGRSLFSSPGGSGVSSSWSRRWVPSLCQMGLWSRFLEGDCGGSSAEKCFLSLESGSEVDHSCQPPLYLVFPEEQTTSLKLMLSSNVRSTQVTQFPHPQVDPLKDHPLSRVSHVGSFG